MLKICRAQRYAAALAAYSQTFCTKKSPGNPEDKSSHSGRFERDNQIARVSVERQARDPILFNAVSCRDARATQHAARETILAGLNLAR